MVVIRKKKIGNAEYFYIEHSVRNGKKIEKIEKYLGKKLPKNINQIKKDFISGIYKKNFFNEIENIKINFSKEHKKMSVSALEKEIENFMIKFTYDTNRIEGSTLTLRETSQLLEKGITPNEKSIRDVKEAESHKKVFFEMLNHKKKLNLQTVLFWHQILLKETKLDISGKIRNHQVAISGSKFVPPLDVELNVLLREFFKWYDKNKNNLYPVELAARVHLKFVTIHPFTDGNGRISRIMMNFVLNKYGYPMMNIHYNGRNSYYNALERSQIKKDDNIFLQWFFKRYIKENKRYLRS